MHYSAYASNIGVSTGSIEAPSVSGKDTTMVLLSESEIDAFGKEINRIAQERTKNSSNLSLLARLHNPHALRFFRNHSLPRCIVQTKSVLYSKLKQA